MLPAHSWVCSIMCMKFAILQRSICSVASLLLGRGNSPTSRPGTCPRILFKGVDSGADAAIFAHFLLSFRDAPFKASPSHSNEICSQSTGLAFLEIEPFKQGEVWSNQDCVNCFRICHLRLINLTVKSTKSISDCNTFKFKHHDLVCVFRLRQYFRILRLRQYFTTLCHTLHPFSAAQTKYLSFSTFPIDGFHR